jgi:hypothetical protein
MLNTSGNAAATDNGVLLPCVGLEFCHDLAAIARPVQGILPV